MLAFEKNHKDIEKIKIIIIRKNFDDFEQIEQNLMTSNKNLISSNFQVQTHFDKIITALGDNVSKEYRSFLKCNPNSNMFSARSCYIEDDMYVVGIALNKNHYIYKYNKVTKEMEQILISENLEYKNIPENNDNIYTKIYK